MKSTAVIVAALVVGAGIGMGCAAGGGRTPRRDAAYGEREESRMAEREVLAMLDALHGAAARADGAAYFALYAPEAVFIGTDARERWTLEEFRAYAEPHFEKGKGWTYVPREGTRHVTMLPGAGDDIAFFDELLDNEKYGTCRGTGVARRVKGTWRVSQYVLTFPVPNEMAGGITAEIKAEEKRNSKE